MAPSLGTKTTGTHLIFTSNEWKEPLLSCWVDVLCCCVWTVPEMLESESSDRALLQPSPRPHTWTREQHTQPAGVHTLLLCSGGTMSHSLAILNPIAVCTKTQVQRDQVDTVRLWKATPSYLSAAAGLVYRRRDSGSGLVLSTATLRPSFRARWHADTQFCQEPSVSWHKTVGQKPQYDITLKVRC